MFEKCPYTEFFLVRMCDRTEMSQKEYKKTTKHLRKPVENIDVNLVSDNKKF